MTVENTVAEGAAPLHGHRAVVRELERLMRETYTLWDAEWVGFSWRNYTADHVLRVRALADRLAVSEGADRSVLEVAALLHDITKPYDGEIMVRDGERVLDEGGFWRNEHLAPTRHNAVTDLYTALELAGSIHNVSGAHVANALLRQYGYPAAFRAHVGEIIVSHLKVTVSSSLEGRCLYDADTIDANLGLPALYRNIQIVLHRRDEQQAALGGETDIDLGEHLNAELRAFIVERWPAWIAGKQRDTLGQLTTEAGRQRASERLARLHEVVTLLRAELEGGERSALESGYLAPIVAFMQQRRNPSLHSEVERLATRWPLASHLPAAHLIDLLRRECSGDL